jgi:ATP-dependent exoDNAse (exonuclease V) alpha subunit
VLNSRDGVIGIEGKAGTGKTKTLEAIVAGIEESGMMAFGCAPSANAAAELRQAGIQEAYTLERVLVDKELQKKLRGQVLLTDEAGMISTRDMGRLFKVAEEQDCRVILSGDYRQHGSVQAGDAFRLLEHEAGVHFARLKEIRRQSVKEYKAAR